MKLKNLFLSVLAGVAVLFSCTPEEVISTLAEFNPEKSYIGFSADGGTITTSVDATAAWSFDTSTIPEWLTVSPTGGSAGKQTLSFTVAKNETGAKLSKEVKVKVGDAVQIFTVTQEAENVEVPVSTCKDVMEGASDKTYRIYGTITKISNTHYGNLYINDGTVEGDGVYIYGTNDKKGQKNSSANSWDNLNDPNYENSWTVAVGDKIMVEGPKTVYNGTVELVDVDIIKLEPSLIDVAPFDFEKIPAEGLEFNMTVSAKESPLLVTSDADWLVIESVNADGSYKLRAAENVRTAERTANITIKGPTAMKVVALTQEGAPATGASVSDIINVEDGSMVQTLPSTVVVALTTKGAVLSDGTKAIYAFGDKAAALKLGDGIKMDAKKTTYNGVPELTDIVDVFVDSENNPVNYPNATDITPLAATYAATEAEFVKLTGTLAVSGNYYNMILDGIEDKQGSIVYPVDGLNAKSFDGKKITVTGYWNGISGKGKYLNVIATKIVEYVDNPKGSLDNPYTPSEIAALILGGTTPDEDVYIKGRVSAVLNTFSAKYGTSNFWISDDGTAYGITEDKKKTTEPGKDFECYGVYTFGNQAWVDGGIQVEVGDEVVVCGKTTLYSGIAETANKKAWIYSINGATDQVNGVGNTSAPFNTAGAVAFIDRMVAAQNAAKEAGTDAPTFPDVCVKGVVSAVLYPFTADKGVASFWISDDGTAYGVSEDKKSTTAPTKDFECYGVYTFGNKAWEEGGAQPAVGDAVVVKGQLTYYAKSGIYETSNKLAWLYSLNGNTGAE